MQRSLACASFLLVAASSGIARAEAAVAADCYTDTAPSFSEKVPVNVPALAVTARVSGTGTATLLSATVAGPNGPSPVVLTAQMDPRSEATLYAPDRALDPMTLYQLNVKLDCQLAGNPGMRDRNTSFVTTTTAPLPTTTGTMKVGRIDAQHWTTAELTPTSELESFLPVTLFDVFVDGKQAGQVPYGFWKMQNGVLAVLLGRSGVGGLQSSIAVCGANENGMKTVALEVRPHVAGTTTDPSPAMLATPIDCSLPPMPKQGGTNPSSPGCSVVGAETQRASTLFALAIAFGVLGLRRRR